MPREGQRERNTIFIIHRQSFEKGGQANDRCAQLSPPLWEFINSSPLSLGTEEVSYFLQSAGSNRDSVSEEEIKEKCPSRSGKTQ